MDLSVENNEMKWKETEIGKIPLDWIIVPLSEISVIITDGSHFSPKETNNGNQIIATVKDMTYNGFNFDNCKKISEEDFEVLLKNGCSPKTGDILISKDGANCLDLIFVYNQNKKIVLLSSIAIVRLKEQYDPYFYRYSLLSPNIQNLMHEGFKSGSAIPRVILKNFKKVPVPQPSFPEQRAIAEILSSIDYKIELNNQMNRTLEATAQAIFKQWFVDFEFPITQVLASQSESLLNRVAEANNMYKVKKTNNTINPLQFGEGGPLAVGEVGYKSSGGKMIDSELGPIPEGWRVDTIENIAEVIGGGTPSTKIESYFVENGIPWITPKDLSGYAYKYIEKGSTDITDEALKNSSARLLPIGTILFSSRAPIGYITIAANPISTNQGFKSLIPKNGMKTEYLFQYIKMITPEIENRATGSTFKEISGSSLKQMSIVVPDILLIDIFEKIIEPINGQMKVIKSQNKTLSTLRDSLLSKLMSGELRVPEEIVKCYEDAL